MKKRTLKWLTFMLAAVMIIAAAGCGNKNTDVSEATPLPEGVTPGPTGQPTPEPTPTPDPMAALKFWLKPLDKDVYYIALIGSDEESPEMEGSVWGHNDTTMILQVDVKNNTMRLASFMRDMWINIPGQSKKYRLNNAYFRGGPDLVKKTIKSVFDVEIDYYAKVNFTTFEQIMKIIGPIMIEVQEDEVEHLRIVESAVSMDGEKIQGYNAIKKAGTHKINAYQALSSARDRHSMRILEDGTKVWNDLGRNDRQREIIRSAWDKVKTKEIIAIPAAAMASQVYVDTDMDLGLIISMLHAMMSNNAQFEDKGFPTSCYEILVNLETQEEFTNSQLEALYKEEKAEYEAEQTSEPSDEEGEEDEEGETQPAEEIEPFPSYEDWMEQTDYASVIGFNESKNIRRLHEFLGIE